MHDINRVILEDIYETVKISVGRNKACEIFMSNDTVYAISKVFGIQDEKRDLISLSTYLENDDDEVYLKIDIKSEGFEFSQEFRDIDIETIYGLVAQVKKVGKYNFVEAFTFKKKTFEYYDMNLFRQKIKELLQWDTVSLTDTIMHNFIEKRNTEFFTGYRFKTKGGGRLI